ncbi:MAG: SH3 domain-containing protein [Cyanobacteria bacterium J06639_14]
MWKPLLTSIAFSATMLLAGGVAQAQTPIPVMAQCPQATWTNGYRIGELIPLHSSQYKPAVVSRDLSRVRAGAGFSSRIIFTMNPGEQVTVTGEAWDIGCNQWMQVIVGEGSYWIHADNLRLLRS